MDKSEDGSLRSPTGGNNKTCDGRMLRPSAHWRTQQCQPSELAIPSAFDSAFHLQADEMLSFKNIIVAIVVFVLDAISAPFDPSPVRSLATSPSWPIS